MKDNCYTITCPECGRKQHFSGAIIDETVSCGCGFRYYVFAANDFRIIMPANEAEHESVARAMRKFVVSTGRCTDIPHELYDDQVQIDIDTVLREYQLDVYGNCYISGEQIDSICECFENGNDVELRKKRDRVEIIELKKKIHKSGSAEQSTAALRDTTKKAPAQTGGKGLLVNMQIFS